MGVLSAVAAKVGRGARGVARLPSTIVRKQISGAIATARTLPGAFKDLALMTTLGPIPAMLGSLIAAGAEQAQDRGEPAGKTPTPTKPDVPTGATDEELLGKIFQTVSEHTGLLERANALGEKSVNNSVQAITTLNAIAAILTKTAEITKEATRRMKAGASDEGLTGATGRKGGLQPANLLGAPTKVAPADEEQSFFGGIQNFIGSFLGSILGAIAVAGPMMGKLAIRALGVVFKRIFPIATILYSMFEGVKAGWKEFTETGSFVKAYVAGFKEFWGSFVNIITFGLVDKETTIKKIDDAFEVLGKWFTNLAKWATGWGDKLAAIEIPAFTFAGYTIGPMRPFAPLVGESVMAAPKEVVVAPLTHEQKVRQGKERGFADQQLLKEPGEVEAAYLPTSMHAPDSPAAKAMAAAQSGIEVVSTFKESDVFVAQTVADNNGGNIKGVTLANDGSINRDVPDWRAAPSPTIINNNNTYNTTQPAESSSAAPAPSGAPRTKAENRSGWDLDTGIGS